jgi:hypothetical protein
MIWTFDIDLCASKSTIDPKGDPACEAVPDVGGVGSGQWAKKKFRTLKFFGHLLPLTPRRVELEANWKLAGSQKKMQKCKFCAISHLIWPTQSKPVKSWTFLGEIVVNLIPLNRFHSESRLHIGAPKTRKSRALGRVMSQKETSTCNITIYGRRWGGSSLVKKKLPTPGSKFFPGTPLLPFQPNVARMDTHRDNL